MIGNLGAAGRPLGASPTPSITLALSAFSTGGASIDRRDNRDSIVDQCAGDLLLHRSAVGSPFPARAAIPPAMDAPNHRVDGWIGTGIPLKGKSDSSLNLAVSRLEQQEEIWHPRPS